MKKNYYYLLIIPVFIFFLIYSCERDKGIDISSDKTNNIFSKNAKYANPKVDLNFTNSGELNVSQEIINMLFSKSKINLEILDSAYNILLYTQGSESGKSEIDTNKLLGISIYRNKNGIFHHSFYKKLNNEFVNIKELDLNCDKITFQNTAFVINYAHLPTNQLSVYNIINTFNINNKTADDIDNSMELEDFVSYYYGKQVKLDNNQIDNGEAVNMIAYGGGCMKVCSGIPTGVCTVGGCHPRGCWSSSAKNLLTENNNTLSINFDDAKLYAIRDNILENSLFGIKYKNYYYNTSFSMADLTLSEAISVAEILPDLYSLYDNVSNNRSAKVVFSAELGIKLKTIIESIKSHNQSNINYIRILDDVKSDIDFLTNKTVGQLNEAIY
jgi:hypothetical protein